MKTLTKHIFGISISTLLLFACSEGTSTSRSVVKSEATALSEGQIVTIEGESIRTLEGNPSLSVNPTIPLAVDVSVDGVRQQAGLQLAAADNSLLGFTVRMHGCNSLHEQSTDVTPSTPSIYGSGFGSKDDMIKLIKGDTGCVTQLDRFVFQGAGETAKTFIANTKEKSDWSERSNVRFTHTADNGGKKHVYLNVVKQLPETITSAASVSFAITTVAVGTQVTADDSFFRSQLEILQNTEIDLEVTGKTLHLNPAGHAVFDFRFLCTANLVRDDHACGNDDLSEFKANLVLDDAEDLVSRMRDDVTQCLDYTKSVGTPKTIRTETTSKGVYTPTTGLTLGAKGKVYKDKEGHTITNKFQINLEYEAGKDSSKVDYWNNWQGKEHGTHGGPNWQDPEQYVLTIDLDGGLPVHTYNETEAPTTEDLQWTVTGWNQTVWGGKIEEINGKTRLYVVGGYRPFDPAENVNAQEDFDGQHDFELIAYTYDGPMSDLAADDLTGKVLGVELRKDQGCTPSDTSRECENQRQGQELSVFKANTLGIVDGIDHTDGGATVQLNGAKRSLAEQADDDYTALNYVLVLGSETTKKCKAWPVKIEKPVVKETIRTTSRTTKGYYTPSTGITLGAVAKVHNDKEGHSITNKFQINLEYEAGKDFDKVDYWNNWQGQEHGTHGGPNWQDPEQYVLNINLDGGLPVHTYGETAAPTTENLQWTITGWNQTVWGGKIEEVNGKTRLYVVGGYRPFDPAENVNVQEDFDGQHDFELIAYTYDGPMSDLAAADLSGVVFGVELRTD